MLFITLTTAVSNEMKYYLQFITNIQIKIIKFANI